MLATIVCLGNPHHLLVPSLSLAEIVSATSLALTVSPLTPFFSSLQVSSACTYMDSVTVNRCTHANTPKECISKVNHPSIFSPYPARPGSEWKNMFVMAYLPSPAGLRRGDGSRRVSGAGAGSVNQQRSPRGRDACWACCCLHAPASPPPPPCAAGLLCNHITRRNSISPSLQRDTLDSANARGTRTIPQSAQPFGGLLGWRSIWRRGGRRVEMQRKTHAQEEEQQTKYTWRGRKKREGGEIQRHKRCCGLPAGDLTQAAGLRYASHCLLTSPHCPSASVALILG